MNDSQEKYTSTIEKIYSTRNRRGYQKVRRLVRWNLYLPSNAHNFCRENKTINMFMFYWLWKFQSNTLINNHFMIKYKEHGMVTRCSRRLVLWYSTASLFFFLYFKTLLARYTEVNATLNNLLFYMNISIWRTVDWNWQCFTKRGV